jgi:hypothetical protein
MRVQYSISIFYCAGLLSMLWSLGLVAVEIADGGAFFSLLSSQHGF